MEINLHMQRPLSCRSVTDTSRSHLKTKQFLGFYSHGSTNLYLQSYSRSKDHIVAIASTRILASAEFSRRRPRNSSTSKPKSSASKGFMPKPQLMGQRKDRKNFDEKEVPDTMGSQEFGGSVRNTFETEHDLSDEEDTKIRQVKFEEVSEDETNEISDTISSARTLSPLAQIDYSVDNGDDSQIDTDSIGLETSRMLEDNTETDGRGMSSEGVDAIRGYEYKQNDTNEIEREMVTTSTSNEVMQDKKTKSKEKETLDFAATGARQEREQIDTIKRNDLQHDSSTKIYSNGSKTHVLPDPAEVSIAQREKQEEVAKLKLEMEAALRKQALERLANQSLSEGSKLFCYPEVVKPDEDVEIFLNRSLSTLNNEPDVYIIGAFNNWRWRSFTMQLRKTNLDGDWWSCQVHVPKEAYKLDFVFFNGKDLYDNNDKKDFCINVDGGMDAFAFEDFLLKERRVELEQLAKEQAERKRQEEEQRRIEAERVASEADKAQAREETAKTRGMMKDLMKKARACVDNVWYIVPRDFKGGDKVRLFYNRSSGPLLHSTELWIHGGYNNWTDGLSIVEKLVRAESKDGDWLYADVSVPARALVLDWVFADGPPQKAVVYDNNSLQDFHSVVPNCIPEEMFWVEEERNIYRKLQEKRRLREEAIHVKAEKTAELKAKTKEKTLKAFLLSEKHIVYTEPLDVQAGKSVTVYYNSANTVLNGKSEIWFRCSFNRWTHRLGPLPQKMLPAENGSHVKATVKVPLDAYMMDFVFSDKEDGGIFDNKNGMDYHIPVSRGVTKEPPLHIVHIAVEMAPIAKVGGLGDVLTSLSRAVQDMNHNVDIILPKYDCLNLSSVKDLNYQKSFSWGGTEIKVWLGNVEGLSVYFLEPQNGYFWTGCIYGRNNDGERFAFFCHAALEFLQQGGFHPDIIHCHDWSSAPVAWLFKEHYRSYGLSKARIVFTIHNLEFGAGNIGRAMAYTDKATTVSPTYSREVSGNAIIAPHLFKFHGILNGIDPDIWDPFNDKFIPIPYTPESVAEGKRAAKEALQQKLGLKRDDKPLVGIVTRLTHQKGIHLIKHAVWRALDRNGQVVLLGSAPDPRIQNDFVNLANQLHSSHSDSARLCLTYDEPLSHLIYAGADFILVPSIFEPCGLTQLIAMRYGSIPVVRKTGGLCDTVFDVDHDKERAQDCGLETNGFSFDGADAAGVDYALNRAISAWYNDREWFNALCKRVMEQDWSWNRPALDYLELYHAARK